MIHNFIKYKKLKATFKKKKKRESHPRFPSQLQGLCHDLGESYCLVKARVTGDKN